MAADMAEYIGEHAKRLMLLVNEVDSDAPDEATVEVLIDAFGRWAAIEQQLLFPVLEAYAAREDDFTGEAERRFDVLRSVHDDIRLEEGADAPYSELASKYVAGVKYHLIVDVEDILPLALEVPEFESAEVLLRMRRLEAKLLDERGAR
ncbi:MAG TPA: hypothetical protein VK983_00565 [Candidatus Limnocylindrales bacterium]|nr:hypothetical protein [Candidatus Limnocylindrales bacterium]